MIKPSDIELFTKEEEEKIAKIISHIDEALKKRRGEVATRVDMHGRIVNEVAKQYADAGWMVWMSYESNTSVMLQVAHSQVRRSDNVNVADVNAQLTIAPGFMRINSSGDLLPEKAQ